MDVADENVAFVGLPIAASGGPDIAVFLYELVHLCTTDDRAPVAGDVVSEGAHNHVAVTLQTPAALDVAVLSVGEGEEGQRLASQLHLDRVAGENVHQTWVVDGRGEPVVGTCYV
jgi:hypothetical protein